MVDTIGSRIKKCRKQLDITQHDLAKRLQGVSHAAISQWESDTTKPNAENLYDLSQIFGCEFVWLLKGKGESPQIVPYMLQNSAKIPILTEDDLQNWDSTQSFDFSGNEYEYIMTDINYAETTFAFKLIDDSMLPEFQAGDLIIFSPDLYPQPGEFILAKKDEQLLFRKYREANNNEFALIPINKDYATIMTNKSDTKIIGTMIEHRIYRRKRF